MTSAPAAIRLLALATMACWAALTVGMRGTLHGTGLDPWTFAMAVQLFAGAVLLVAAGLRALPTQPLRRWSTWVIGGLRVVTTCAFTAALLHASAAEISLLGAVNVLIATLGVFLVFRRVPRPVEAVGFALMLLGLVLLVGNLPGGWSNPALVLLLTSESSVVCAALLAERHPDNLGDRRARLALTGFVMLLSTAGLMAIWVAAAVLLPALPVGPGADRVTAAISSPVFWLAAFALGAALRGPGTYAAFTLTARIGTDGYLLSMAALPLATLACEAAAAALGVLPRPGLAPMNLLVMALIVGGGFWNIAMRLRRK
jgi:drug/metabolite transporter (DMT)-like permease